MPNTPDHNFSKLQEGFLFWNRYRSSLNNKEHRVDFRNLKIVGDHWRYNELKSAELDHCDFRHTEFRDIDFIGIDFSKSDFSNARFINVHFTKCHFSENAFTNAYFKDTSWFYVSLTDLIFPPPENLDHIRFFKCTIGSSILQAGIIPPECFEECEFIGTE
jgi:uncharacterized protein YjbI with pentapeptide repeats